MVSGQLACTLRGVRLALDARDATLVDVRLQGGLIADIRAHQDGPLAEADPNDVDSHGLLILPGFVNAHAHSNESFEAGAYEGGPLEAWLTLSYPPLRPSAVPARWHYLRAMHLARQSLRSGVTAIHDDFVNPGGDPEALAQVMSAYVDVGIRARVAVTMADRGYLDGLPGAREACPPHLAQQLDARSLPDLPAQRGFFESAFVLYGNDPTARVGLSLGPRGPQRCTSALLHLVVDLAKQYRVPVQMHVLETRAQATLARERHGRTFVEVLQEGGLLGPALAMNHAVWLTSDDVARIAASGARVVHNPLSNFKLSSGLCPVRALLAAGVPIALGTDGAATSDSLDYFDTLRFAALAHKLDAQAHQEPPPSAAQVIRMATRSGADSMGGAGLFGEIAVGQSADFTLIDTRDPALVPLNDPPRQLCYAATSRCVHSVFVEGVRVYSNGRCLRIDEDALDAEIAEAAEQARRARRLSQTPDELQLLATVRTLTDRARDRSRSLSTLNQMTLR